VRLVCLPHAGAGASTYFAWGAALQAAQIEVRPVQYPGRENRLAEPLVTSVAEMTHLLADAWPQLSEGGECAVFGHSMGALLAYELALELARRGTANLPGRLFLSGRNPPGTPPKLAPIHDLPDAEFLREIAGRYGSLPPAVLTDPELMALVTPVLRTDFRLVDEYRGNRHPPAAVPLTILAGTRDPWTTEAELEGWRACTTATCRVRWFEGYHFFHQKERAAVIAAVRSELAAAGPGVPASERPSLAFDGKEAF
jgi:medium-chain acyl-[acyl-carrier-protein] hydrolase